MAKCPNCGTETDSKFCPNCGANLQESVVEEPVAVKEEPIDIATAEKSEKEKKKKKEKKSKTTICKHCGAEIAVSAKKCPQCGGKNKKPIYKRVWFWILLVVVIALIFGTGNSYKTSDDADTMSEADYQAACQEMSYKDLARNAEDLVGQKVKFTGQIFQVAYDADGNGESEYLVAVTKDEWDFYSDNVYLYFNTGDGPKLIEDDIITFYGEVSGTYSYTSVLGESITIPAITGVYCYLNE